jgi:hypothetical protein
MAAASLGAGTVDLELWAGIRANQSPVVQAAALQNVMVPVADTPDQAHSAAGLGHAGGRRSVCPQWRSQVLVFGCPDKAWSGSARARSMCRAHVVDHV